MPKIGDTKITAVKLHADFDSEAFHGLAFPLIDCPLDDRAAEQFDVWQWGYDPEDDSGPDWQPVARFGCGELGDAEEAAKNLRPAYVPFDGNSRNPTRH